LFCTSTLQKGLHADHVLLGWQKEHCKDASEKASESFMRVIKAGTLKVIQWKCSLYSKAIVTADSEQADIKTSASGQSGSMGP